MQFQQEICLSLFAISLMDSCNWFFSFSGKTRKLFWRIVGESSKLTDDEFSKKKTLNFIRSFLSFSVFALFFFPFPAAGEKKKKVSRKTFFTSIVSFSVSFIQMPTNTFLWETNLSIVERQPRNYYFPISIQWFVFVCCFSETLGALSGSVSGT